MEPVTTLLQQTGMTMTALGRIAHVSRASVSEYVNGHRQPSVGQLERLAAAAGRRTDIRFPPAWAARKQQLEDVLELADALPLRRQPARTRTWREVTCR